MTALPQLRLRTEFSFRDVFGPVPRVAEALKALGTPAAGIVDGDTWGHVRWAKAAAKAGFKPLFGTELRVVQPDGRKPTAWALAEDTKAFYRFSTAARVPEADIAALFRETRDGVLRFAGAGLDDPECFDYVDVNPATPLLVARSVALAARTGKPLVLTSDNYYPNPAALAEFMAISGQARITPQHILSVEELRAALRMPDDLFEAAVRNTFEVAERCASVLPTAPIIKVEGDLRALAEAGKLERLRLGHIREWTEEYETRFQYELRLIHEKVYESYFMVVGDLVHWAKQHMLVGPGRGSSAGSLICYLLRITEVNPLMHDLMFERFVDMTRKDLPDIDIDFADSKRDRVFTYLADKYGRENVARIGNINTLRARSVIARVCEKLGIPDREKFDVLNVLVEYSSGDARYGHSLEDTMTQTEPGRRFAALHPEAMPLFSLENHASHTGVHAAGVIVCNEAVCDFCTVGPDGVAHIDKPDSEALNLLKIDALGLRTLGVIEDAGVVDAETLYGLALDDPEVLDIFNQHKYSGIFQFEGQAQRRVAAEVHIDSFRKIDHVTALARPGPLGGGASQHYIARAAGREPITYRHPSMEAYLSKTLGVVLYQEQVMRITYEMGKFNWAIVNEIRKAMSGRKGKEYFDRRGEEFAKGAEDFGLSEHDAKEIWSEINAFGAWGMNACAGKDTRVLLAHPNQTLGRVPTIEALFEFYVGAPSAWVRQKRLMPVVMCVGADGVARPKMARNIHKNGERECVRLTFDDGSQIECTPDHRFVVDGVWQACGKARVGAEFSRVERLYGSTKRGAGGGKGWLKGLKWVDGKRPEKNGKSKECIAFRKSHHHLPCEGCGHRGGRMEVHHNDLDSGNQRPKDLAWLCNACHKQRHIDNGSRRAPYSRGHYPAAPRTLMRVEKIGRQMTYDIEMDAPDHNYVLDGGIITHNSHTVSYGIISYWCAWMKRYHPLEYAAACLRNAKDDAQTVEILRELMAEGTRYVPFDIDQSEEHWAAKDGMLIGGFQNLVGFGPAKSLAAIEARRAGTMTAKLRERIANAEVKFTELNPLRAQYGALYNDPESFGCRAGSRVFTLDTMPSESWDVLTLLSVRTKQLRDINEDRLVQRRDGKRFDYPTIFLDIICSDDTGIPMTLRVDRKDFEDIGQLPAANLREGDVLLVRGRKIANMQMIKVKRLRCLNRPEALQPAPYIEGNKDAQA